MRWFWIDRFEEFVRGQHAVAVKNVTLAEEPLDEYFPGFPHYPHSLIIEGTAQAGGLLVSESTQFQNRVVLAKVSKAEFKKFVTPGDQLRIHVTIQDTQAAGAVIEGKCYIENELQGELELWFAFLDSRFGDKPHFPPGYLMRWLRTLRVYDVGVDSNGQPLKPPEFLLEAEKQAALGII